MRWPTKMCTASSSGRRRSRSFAPSSTGRIWISAAVRRCAGRSGELVVEVYATMPQIDRLRAARSAPGVTMNVVENATQTGRARQAEVGRRNRFAGRQAPRGLGIKE